MNIKTPPIGAEIVTGNMTRVVQIGQLISIRRDSLTAIMTEGTTEEMTEGIILGAGILMSKIEGRLKTEREGLSMTDENSERKESTIHTRKFSAERKRVDLQGEVGLQKSQVAIPEKKNHIQMIDMLEKVRKPKSWPRCRMRNVEQ